MMMMIALLHDACCALLCDASGGMHSHVKFRACRCAPDFELEWTSRGGKIKLKLRGARTS